MANTILSPNMNLPIPSVGVDAGPDWAYNVNSCLGAVDAHDHSNGKGVPVTPAGISISSDLSFNSNNATLLRSARLSIQTVVFSSPSDINCIYDVNGDLYFSDGSGNQVRITQAGSVAGTPGSIANLSSPASASYVSGSQTFVWQSDANTAANMDFASIIIRDTTALSNGITISAPNALASNYSLVLPAAPPSSQKFMTMDNGGNIAAPYVVDNSTVEISANQIQVKDGGITPQKMAALGQQISSSSSTYATSSTTLVDVSNLQVTITTTGRPVFIGLISAGSSDAFIGVSSTVIATASANYVIARDGVSITNAAIQVAATSPQSIVMVSPPGAIFHIDPVAAGTYVYKLRTQVNDAAVLSNVSRCKLVAYEIF